MPSCAVDSCGLDYLGGVDSRLPLSHSPWWMPALSVGAGVAGALAWRKHPVLGFLSGSAVATALMERWQAGVSREPEFVQLIDVSSIARKDFEHGAA